MTLKQTFALLAVIITFTLTTNSCNTPASADNKSDAVLENIATRTSIRAYTDQEIDEQTITEILKAAMAAPTAVNSQPWVFYVIKDKALLEQISEASQGARMAKDAAIAIVPCGNREKFLKGGAEGFWIQDLSAATQNILLAAHSLGLGAVWTGIYPNLEKVKTIAQIIGADSRHIPLCVIPIGYPAETPQPKDKWKPENVFYR